MSEPKVTELPATVDDAYEQPGVEGYRGGYYNELVERLVVACHALEDKYDIPHATHVWERGIRSISRIITRDEIRSASHAAGLKG